MPLEWELKWQIFLQTWGNQALDTGQMPNKALYFRAYCSISLFSLVNIFLLKSFYDLIIYFISNIIHISTIPFSVSAK